MFYNPKRWHGVSNRPSSVEYEKQHFERLGSVSGFRGNSSKSFRAAHNLKLLKLEQTKAIRPQECSVAQKACSSSYIVLFFEIVIFKNSKFHRSLLLTKRVFDLCGRGAESIFQVI